MTAIHSSLPPPALLAHAADLLTQADALIVAAGAGIGVDSGLPDFRGQQGFWQAYPALAQQQIDFSQIASPQAFHAHAARAWGFYGHRLGLYRATEPHRGFEILKKWGARMPLGSAVFTSNVDGQFQKAGFDAGFIEECHGSIHHLQCARPCSDDIWSAGGFVPEVDEENCLLLNALPACPACGGLARPNVLMFGDWDWQAGRQAAQAQNLERWLSNISRPVVVEIGAGSAIPSVRHFSQRVIHTFGGRLIRINPREAGVPTRWDVGLAGNAEGVLQAIDRIVCEEEGG